MDTPIAPNIVENALRNPNMESLKGTMSGTNVTPTPAGQPQPSPVAPIGPAPTANTGQSNQFALANVMSSLEAKVQSNNNLMTQRNLLLKHLYDQPLTPQEKQQLDPSFLPAISKNDRNQIDMSLRLISDEIAGRTSTLDQSVKFLTQSYQQEVDRAEKAKQDAIDTYLEYKKVFGSNASEAIAKLYGPEIADQLSTLDNVPTLAQTQAGIAVTPALGNSVGNVLGLPSYDTKASNPTLNRPTRNNNPGNIKVSAFSKSFPGVVGVESSLAADGGNFLIFDSPEAGLNAIGQLLQQGKSYQGVSAEKAMKAYSGGGYGASAVGLDPNSDFQTQISDSATRDAVVQAIAKREGFQTGGTPVGPNLSSDAIDLAAQQYLLTGTMPALGMGSSPGVQATRSAILNRAAELGAGTIPGLNKAVLSTLTGSLKTQQSYLDVMQRSINTVDSNLQLLMGAADKVNKSDSPLVNEWNNLAKQKVIGSGDLNAYQTALQTVRSEYSTILSRGQGQTDATRAEAAKLIPDNITKAQLQQVVNVLKTEGQNVVKSAQTQVDSIQKQMQGVLTGGTVTPLNTGSLAEQVKAKGYDYEKMKADGFDDNEIKQTLGL